jgi:hypothetical protein
MSINKSDTAIPETERVWAPPGAHAEPPQRRARPLGLLLVGTVGILMGAWLTFLGLRWFFWLSAVYFAVAIVNVGAAVALNLGRSWGRHALAGGLLVSVLGQILLTVPLALAGESTWNDFTLRLVVFTLLLWWMFRYLYRNPKVIAFLAGAP